MSALPDFRTMLAELIASPSISCADPALDCGNRPAAELLAGWLGDCGFDCELMPLPDRPDKVNLIATLGAPTGEAPQGLVMAGHLDTVPYDAEGWDSDPFTLTERDQRLYGLGTCDMKGFIALAAAVAGEYEHKQLRQPLTLLASADEECGMDGARALLDAGRCPGRHAIIGEPTNLVPIHRHKGILMDAVRVHGKAGHSSNPAHGVNAIEGMRLAMNAVAEFRDELAATADAGGFPVGHATLNLGVLRGGDSPNRIPALCELQVDLRFPPGRGIDSLRSQLRARVEHALAHSECRVDYTTLFTGTPAMDTPADAAIVRAAERLSGHQAACVDFGTEGEFYNRLGMQTVICGPGDIAQAHQPNEYLALDRIEPMRRILHGLVREFCLDA